MLQVGLKAHLAVELQRDRDGAALVRAVGHGECDDRTDCATGTDRRGRRHDVMCTVGSPSRRTHQASSSMRPALFASASISDAIPSGASSACNVAYGRPRTAAACLRLVEATAVAPGDVVVIPPNLPHEALMIGEVEEIATWAPPRQEWLDKTDDYLRK